MSAPLLSSEQLSEWTGIKQPSRLITWLNKNGIPYRLNSAGRPITTTEAVNASLLERQIEDEVNF